MSSILPLQPLPAFAALDLKETCSATILRLCARAAKASGRPLLTAFSWYAAHQTLTFDELRSKGGGVATKVDVGTFLQNEWVFLVKRVAT